MSNIAVQLTSISKKYIVHHEKPTLVENIMQRKHPEEFWALRDINLIIKKGERVGIIGPNGAGKTTLLKIIARITKPTHGKVLTQGKVASLIETRAGFQPDLTGEENIMLNGLLIGMAKNEIQEKMKSIIQFADIGDFIDVPFYTYSQGMIFRLGLSITIHSDFDILLLDEGLAVADKPFQVKSGKKIRSFFLKRKTILAVTHWVEFLEEYFDSFFVLEDGRIIKSDVGKISPKIKNSYFTHQ